ncbi:MAG: hypothetical protein D6698_11370 [Gammaproteobacteria bacterium]|nr:MAG: hypothetical protein D6698_11370 [Gammaproteobacteria bacterium]
MNITDKKKKTQSWWEWLLERQSGGNVPDNTPPIYLNPADSYWTRRMLHQDDTYSKPYEDYNGMLYIQKLRDQLHTSGTIAGGGSSTVAGIGFSAKPKPLSYNPLHDVLVPQYHIRVSMLTYDVVQQLQNGSLPPDYSFDYERHLVLFETGKGAPENTKLKHYYNLRAATMTNTLAPTNVNRTFSMMTGMNLEVFEPVGVDIAKDISDLAKQAGYPKVAVGRYIFRVDIWFSGYDQKTGVWNERVAGPITNFMVITDIKGQIGPDGLTHNISMAVANHQALRTEDTILDGGSFQVMPTLGETLSRLGETLKEQKKARTDGEIIRNYEFYGPAALMQARFDSNAAVGQVSKVRVDGEQHTFNINKGSSLISVIDSLLGAFDYPRKAFLTDDRSGAFSVPRIVWTVTTNTIYKSPDPIRGDYREITYQYYLLPTLTFKQGPVTKDTSPIYVDQGNQKRRIEMMLNLGLLKRRYDFLHTSTNTDVIDMSMDVSAFYRRTLEIERVYDSSPAAGIMAPNEATPAPDNTNRFTVGDQTFVAEIADVEYPAVFDDKPRVTSYIDQAKEHNGEVNAYIIEREDYFELDFVSIKMSIKGDPLWITNRYSIEQPTDASIQSLEPIHLVSSEGVPAYIGDQTFLLPHADAIIYVRSRMPEQDNYHTGAEEYNDVVSGFYQVIKVDSKFNADGSFTQDIEAVRLDHIFLKAFDLEAIGP